MIVAISPPKRKMDKETVLAVYAKTDGRCWYCGVSFRMTSARIFDPTIDHITPVIIGGGNEIHNLVPCCRGCNGIKGDRPARYLRMRLLLRSLEEFEGELLDPETLYLEYLFYGEGGRRYA